MSRRQAAPVDTDLQIREFPATLDLRELHARCPDRYPFLLQSTARVSRLGRYDILFAFPGESLALDRLTTLSGPFTGGNGDFLRNLDCWWQQERCENGHADIPFSGGWFVYLGYELAAQVETTLRLEPDPVLPTAFAVRCPAAIIRDHSTAETFAVCERAAGRFLDMMWADARTSASGSPRGARAAALHTIEEREDCYLEAVRRAKQYIAEGDIYQANLSRFWRAELAGVLPSDDVYARLCAANPAPFAASVRWKGASIISSSPERLIAVRDRRVSTRPIAGTRPRGFSSSSDNALSNELISHPKERAEHVMLIDLERNDLGRVCEPGSVVVDEFMILESYAHVHHIVSNVTGTLKKDVTPGDAIRAVFPGGTITGCPKVRCMEIIGELEQSPRGAYTGSLGYLNRDGSMDLNILIRTMVVAQNALELKAGSGIVADSDPAAELAETRAKAKGLLMALGPA